MSKIYDMLKKNKRQIIDSLLCMSVLIGTFLVFVLSTLKDLPFVYSQF